MDPQIIKDELTKILGREPSCSLLKTGKYMADYFKVGSKPTEFIGATEDEALEKLHSYLKSKPQVETVR